MRVILLLFIVLAILVVGITFGIQNSQMVEIRFFQFPSGPIPLWVISYVSALVGALLALCGCMISIIKEKAIARGFRREIAQLKVEIDSQRNVGITHDVPPETPSPVTEEEES